MPFDFPFLVLAVLGFAVLFVAVHWLFPTLLTPLFRVVVRIMYRFRVHGADRVPLTGPVLIVSNHVTYLDWLVLWAASPRPLTFVLWQGFFRHPILRIGLSFARGRLVAIDNRPGRPHSTAVALDRVAAALAEGRAVVVFPEGALSRNGQMLPFGRGIEWVLKRAGVPVAVVPAYLDNLWGSLLSYDGGRLFGKRPTLARRRVAVGFGSPIPPTLTAAEIRLAVCECSAECGIRESDRLLPVHREFVRCAARWRNLKRTAFVDVATGTERRLTFPRALVASWCLSRWLRQRLGPEPHVGLWLPTGMGAALGNIALSFLGKTTVNLNYTAGPVSVATAARQAGLRCVLTSKRFVGRVPLELPDDVQRLYLEDALGAIPAVEKLLTFLKVLLLPGWLLERLLGLTRTQLDDVITIIFSSGSTGEPKGVMLSHRNVAANVDQFRRGVELLPADRILSTLPVFHSFGYTVGMWAPVLVGMQTVFYPDPRQAKEVGELCKQHACTIMLGTATFLRFYLRRCGADDFRSTRLIICGAEKLPVSLAEEFQAKFGVLPLEGYGCSELSPVVSTNVHDVTVAGICQKANTFGTVGQPMPGIAVKPFDSETRTPLPPDVDGVLAVKGANVMLGYLGQPEKTKQVIVDGWYLTGDMGHIEPAGFIRITGRLSRFAKIAGEMVPVERIEDEMHDVLAAGGDRMLAVAAVPDAKRGERLVVLHLPQVRGRLEEVFTRLRERGLPNLWIPDVRDCREVEAFPVLGSGKLDLRGLSELAKSLDS